MKPIYSYALLAAFAAVGQALAVDATTTPVGYVSLGNATSPAVPAETDFFISLPLDRPNEAAGTVSSVSDTDADTIADTITLSGTPGLGTYTGGVPYVVKVNSGAASGLVALIVGNTSGSVKVQLQPGDSLASIVVGDKVAIQKAWTPLSLFAGNAALADGTQLLAYSGTAPGTNIASDVTFEFAGGTWTDLTTFGSADDAVLYPGEGLVLRTIPGGAISAPIVISGQVPVSNSRATLVNLDAGGQDNIVSFTSPVAERLDSTGLGFNVGDQILLLDDFDSTAATVTAGQNKAAVRTIEYQGAGAWLDLTSFTNVETTFFTKPGESFIYRIAAGAPLVDTVWSNQPAYVPTL